jgi:hypothetical protein
MAPIHLLIQHLWMRPCNDNVHGATEQHNSAKVVGVNDKRDGQKRA